MLVCTAFHPGDFDQALHQAQWLYELNGAKGHKLLLVRDTRCSPESTEQLRAEYAKSYDSVELLDVVDHYHRWPNAPNHAIATAARHIMRTQPQPWFWCEPDLIFLKPNAIDAFWAEYQAAGKLFSGDFVSAETAGINVIDHCSGNMILPADLFTHAGLILISDDVAYDVAAASQIVPQMHRSELLLHRWKSPPFESWEQVQQRIFDVKPSACLYHASKDGSLIRLLREHNLQSATEKPTTAGALDVASEGVSEANSIGVSTNDVKIETQTATKPAPPSPFTCDIFIKTYPPDADFLRYCLRSINKFCIGFRELVIVHPSEQILAVSTPNISWRRVPKDEYGEDGYLSQQVFKLYADTLTYADILCFVDSDTIFTRPVTPETYFRDGKPIWLMTPWEKTETPWRPIVEKFMGQPVEFEFMRRAPVVCPRWLLAEVREFCLKQHGVPLDQYVMSQPHRAFSEFNVLGAFAYQFHHDKFLWVNTEEVPESEWPELTVLQKWSHGGLRPEIISEFEDVLSLASELVSPEPSMTSETPPAIATDQIWVKLDADGKYLGVFEFDGKDWIEAKWPRHTANYQMRCTVESITNTHFFKQEPWADKGSSLAEIGRLSARLKEFCTGPVRTRQVRDVLRENGVIK